MYPIKPALFLLSAIALSSCGFFVPKSDANPENYEAKLTALRASGDVHGGLYIFPDSHEIGEVKGYKHMEREGLLGGDYLLYLSLKLNEEAYASEIARLSKIYAVFGDPFSSQSTEIAHIKRIIHDEEKHAYMTICMNSTYEYAEYNNESLTINYVFNQFFSWTETGLKHYLSSFNIPKEVEDDFAGSKGYQMYYYYEDDVGYPASSRPE